MGGLGSSIGVWRTYGRTRSLLRESLAFRGVQVSKGFSWSTSVQQVFISVVEVVRFVLFHNVFITLQAIYVHTTKEDRVKMERALGLLLCPLPWKALPVMSAGVQQPPPILKLRNVMRGAPWHVDITDVEAENVFVKVKRLFSKGFFVPALVICSNRSVPLAEDVVNTFLFCTLGSPYAASARGAAPKTNRPHMRSVSFSVCLV